MDYHTSTLKGKFNMLNKPLSSRQIEMIAYALFQNRGAVLAQPFQQGGGKAPKYNSFKNSEAYQLCLRHLVINRHIYPQYSAHSARIQAKAFMLATRVNTSDTGVKSFINELEDNLLKDSRAIAESCYHSDKDIFFLALDIRSSYTYRLKIQEGHLHYLQFNFLNDDILNDGYLEHWVPSISLATEKTQRLKSTLSACYSQFELSFLRPVNGYSMLQSLTLLNYKRKPSKKDNLKNILANAEKTTVANNSRIALLYITLSFVIYMYLVFNYLESNTSIFSLGLLNLLHTGCIIHNLSVSNKFKSMAPEEMKKHFSLFTGSYLNPDISNDIIALIHLGAEFLSTRYYLGNSLTFFYILKKIGLNTDHGPIEIFKPIKISNANQKIRKKHPRPPSEHNCEKKRDELGPARQQHNTAASTPVKKNDSNSQELPDKKKKIKTRPLDRHGISNATSIDANTNDCQKSSVIEWVTANEYYHYSENPIEQNELDLAKKFREVFPIFLHKQLMFFAAFDQASGHTNQNETTAKAKKILERGRIVGQQGQQGIKPLKGSGKYEIKTLGASGNIRFAEKIEANDILDKNQAYKLKLFDPRPQSHKDVSHSIHLKKT